MIIDKQVSRFLNSYAPDLFERERIAVAVSGGGDSMALSHALCIAFPDVEIHFLTVDHRLRPDASEEAQKVKEWVSGWGVHKTLVWEHDGVDSKIQEEARLARYRLLCEYCKEHDISALFVGHNQDDLIETFLMRLSSGSGIDGLSSIAPMSWQDDIAVLRPFYEVSHEDIINYCREESVPWIEDPSNDKEQYKRVRFRKAQEFLEEEGLTPKRLSKTIERMARARDAMDQMTVFLLEQIMIEQSEDTCVLSLEGLNDLHSEFQLRALMMVIEILRESDGYPPRLEKLEGLVFDIGREGKPFRKRTFAGCLFEAKPKENAFVISVEQRP